MRQLTPDEAKEIVEWLDQHDWDCFSSSTGDAEGQGSSNLVTRSEAPEHGLLKHPLHRGHARGPVSGVGSLRPRAYSGQANSAPK